MAPEGRSSLDRLSDVMILRPSCCLPAVIPVPELSNLFSREFPLAVATVSHLPISVEVALDSTWGSPF